MAGHSPSDMNMSDMDMEALFRPAGRDRRVEPATTAEQAAPFDIPHGARTGETRPLLA
jgi:hypothetical protein